MKIAILAPESMGNYILETAQKYFSDIEILLLVYNDYKECVKLLQKNKKKYDILGKDYIHKEANTMQHIKTLNTKNLQNTVKKGGCGECQTSCQSACKTSCTVGNQSCENK